MQLLLFSKQNPEPGTPSVLEWELSQKDEIIRKVSMSGTVCLISDSSWQLLDGSFTTYVNCGIKKERVELFRSLRFHENKDRLQPKRLIFHTSDRGALKRSLDKFYSNRYTAADPACLIITSEEILESMIEDYQSDARKKSLKNRKKNSNDPLSEMLMETATNKVVMEVSKVFLGTSYDSRLVRMMILKASESKSPVLILGESGTGKDVIARQIAKYSKYYTKSFSAVNCAAFPETLLESELFGYVQGSFTGALTDKAGLFEAHAGGIIFLDEIGDLSLANQAKLLLAIDSKQIRRIGSNETTDVDVRIIAATNRNIDNMARSGSFREDLLYRLNVLRIYAPPLRLHPEDIPAIADHIWRKLSPAGKLSAKFHQHLMAYPWPGNVRELKSLLTSIIDLFAVSSPTPAHIESIRNTRRDKLLDTINSPVDDKTQLLKLEAKLRLTNLQNIVRGIKVAMRPVINKELTPDNYRQESDKIKNHIAQQVALIENICLEPVYFKDFGLFRETTRYRYLLEKMLRHWPGSQEELFKVWSDELQKLDDNITLGIMELMWGKIDM